MCETNNNDLTMFTSEVVRLYSQNKCVEAGYGRPTRINALVGMSHPRDRGEQLNKIEVLERLDDKPHIVSDLSIVKEHKEKALWQIIAEQTSFVAGTLPIYTAIITNDRIDAKELLDIAAMQMEAGVGLLTIHPTATWETIELAKERLVPWTSRGGGLVIRDMIARGKGSENAYFHILPDLVSFAQRFGTVLSLGATFRSANIFDSCDMAQVHEIDFQIQLAREISHAGVGVIIESPGHAHPSNITKIAMRLRQARCPIMPLGPIPTDIATGMDHISSAIGATILGLKGCAHILAAVTREEHTGGIPNIDSTVESVRAAFIAAHIIDLELLGSYEADWQIASTRAEHHTCVLGRKARGCSRCGRACPL